MYLNCDTNVNHIYTCRHNQQLCSGEVDPVLAEDSHRSSSDLNVLLHHCQHTVNTTHLGPEIKCLTYK